MAGVGIEDYSGDSRRPFHEIELAVERVRAAREALADPFVLTARAECFLYAHPDPCDESVKRINRYFQAGADCLYLPGFRDIVCIRALVAASAGPINVVMGLAGTPISVAELRAAGVARISIGGSLARAALGLVRRAAREILDRGSFDFTAGQIADAELDRKSVV